MAHDETPDQTSDLGATGERIDALLTASATGGVVARERAEELVRLVTDLYGSGLEQVMEILHESGHLDDDLLHKLASDELVSGLLLVHGLHPYSVEQRVEDGLESVRPYLGSHGGDVELLAVTDDGTVRLRLLGSCDGCPSSSVTLKLAVDFERRASGSPTTTGIRAAAAEQPKPDRARELGASIAARRRPRASRGTAARSPARPRHAARPRTDAIRGRSGSPETSSSPARSRQSTSSSRPASWRISITRSSPAP